MQDKTEDKLSTKSAIQQVLRHSIIYGVTSSLQSLVGFIILPILTLYIAPDLFGVYSILLLTGAFASAIFYLGASSALGRFYFDEDTLEHKKKVISTAFYITIFGALLLIFLSSLYAEFISIKLFSTKIYAKHIILSLSGAAIGFLLNLMAIILRYQKKPVSFLIISLLGLVINFSFTYYLLSVKGFQILAPIYGSLISNSFCFILLTLLSYRYFILDIDGKYFKNILSFGIQASAIGLLFYVLEWVDRLIIKDLLNLESVGIYSLGYRLSAFINILFITPFSLIWAPTRMEYAKKKNAGNFMSKVSSYYSLVGVLFVVLAMLFGEEVMKLLFKNPSYQYASNVFPIVMLANFFFGYQNILDIGIHISKKLYFYIIISILSISINVGLNYIFIPMFGYMAAAFVTLFTYIFSATSSYIIANRYYKIPLEFKRLTCLFLYLIGIFIFMHKMHNTGSIYNFLSKLIVLIISVYMLYRFWLDAAEREFIKSLYQKYLPEKKSL